MVSATMSGLKITLLPAIRTARSTASQLIRRWAFFPGDPAASASVHFLLSAYTLQQSGSKVGHMPGFRRCRCRECQYLTRLIRRAARQPPDPATRGTGHLCPFDRSRVSVHCACRVCALQLESIVSDIVGSRLGKGRVVLYEAETQYDVLALFPLLCLVRCLRGICSPSNAS